MPPEDYPVIPLYPFRNQQQKGVNTMPQTRSLKEIVASLAVLVLGLLNTKSHEADEISRQKGEIKRLEAELAKAQGDDAETAEAIPELENLVNAVTAANPPAREDIATARTIGATPIDELPPAGGDETGGPRFKNGGGEGGEGGETQT